MADEENLILEPNGTEFRTAAGGARRYCKPLRSFRWRDIKALLTESLDEWSRHKAPRLGGVARILYIAFADAVTACSGVDRGSCIRRHCSRDRPGRTSAKSRRSGGRNGDSSVAGRSRRTAHGVLGALLGLLTLFLGLPVS